MLVAAPVSVNDGMRADAMHAGAEAAGSGRELRSGRGLALLTISHRVVLLTAAVTCVLPPSAFGQGAAQLAIDAAKK